jgi:hypothetical protein
VPIAGAPHGLSQKKSRDDVPEVVVREFEEFFSISGDDEK